MSKQTGYANTLLFCLGWQLAVHSSAEPVATMPAPPAVHAQVALRATLAAGKPTPLDALTPYGKRLAIEQMRWNDKGLAGFGTAPLVRELDHDQLAAVLHFLDADSYLPMLDKQLIGAPLRLPAPSAQVEQDLQSLRRFADADALRRANAAAAVATTELGAPAVLRQYHTLFARRLDAPSLSAVPPGDLVVMFDAAGLAANGNPASSALDDMLRLHRELAARGLDTRRTLDSSVLYALLAARRFEDARAFAAIRPALADAAIPQIVDTLGTRFTGRSAFAYDGARNTLTRVALPMQSGTELVMVVGAGCHNSTNALNAIHDDPALQARLQAAHLVLVTAPNAPVEMNLITEWNAANPAMPIRAPYNTAEWRAIDVTGIPAFYLLRNGKVVDQRSGWSAEGKADLIELIDAADRETRI